MKKVRMMESKPAEDIHFQWAAGEVCFNCPCGAKEIIISEGGDMKICDCGKRYRLVHYVAIEEVKK